MKKLVIASLAFMLFMPQLNGQSKDEAAIKADIIKTWKDAAQRKIDKSLFDSDNVTSAYSTGGLWEHETGDELAKKIVGGPNTFVLTPYHMTVRFVGSKKDVAYTSYYLVGNIMRGDKVIVPNYRTRISQVSEKRGGKWVTVANHASPLFGGSGIRFE